MAQGLTTIRDVVAAYDGGVYADAANLIYVSNPMLQDAPVQEANNFDVHKDTQIVQLPANSSRKYNEGVKPTKSVRNKILVPIGITESHMNIDKELLDVQPDKAAYLRTEGETHIQSIATTIGRHLIYADSDVDEQVGLANIYNDQSKDFIAKQIIDAGGVEANGLTSIWLIAWQPSNMFLTYPRGSSGGYKMQKFQSDKLYDDAGGAFMGASVMYQMRLAPVPKQIRSVVRVANIPTNNLSALKPIELFQAAYLRQKDNGIIGNRSFYVNESIFNSLFSQILEQTRALTVEYVNNEPQFKFWGIPIKKDDQLVNAEAQVA